MMTFEQIAADENVRKEYKKSFLLNMFKKIVIRMNRDNNFKQHVRKLFLQSTDVLITTKVLISGSFDFNLDEDDSMLMSSWFKAYFQKNDRRKPFTIEFKKRLYVAQHGICMVCGEPLGNDMSKIHVDHIIPWMLVGDELKDNYQCLCETCNECKSAHTDYIFKNLLKLV